MTGNPARKSPFILPSPLDLRPVPEVGHLGRREAPARLPEFAALGIGSRHLDAWALDSILRHARARLPIALTRRPQPPPGSSRTPTLRNCSRFPMSIPSSKT